MGIPRGGGTFGSAPSGGGASAEAGRALFGVGLEGKGHYISLVLTHTLPNPAHTLARNGRSQTWAREKCVEVSDPYFGEVTIKLN